MSEHPLSARGAPIVAIATAPGRGAVGIVRASGADLRPLIQAVCGRMPAPRQATVDGLALGVQKIQQRGLSRGQ